MEEKIRYILEEYIKNVEDICNNLLKGINDSQNLNLKNKWDFFVYRADGDKMEFEVGGISYRLHGKGCMAFNEKIYIDWDFGYRSRWCGIDPWKVSMTLEYSGKECYDGTLIEEVCKNFVTQGIMFEKRGQYYFAIPKDETFEPQFPKEYDTLVIEYFDKKFSIPRNKLIDRFIRKSRRVYNQIDKNEDKYILRFLLREKEVFSIPYTDTGYPENAVKIMSDVIIQNLMKYTIK